MGILNERLYIMKNNYCQILLPDLSILYLSLFLSVSITLPLYLPVYSLSLSFCHHLIIFLCLLVILFIMFYFEFSLYASVCLSVCVCVCVSQYFFLPVSVCDIIYVFTSIRVTAALASKDIMNNSSVPTPLALNATFGSTVALYHTNTYILTYG